MQKLKTKCEKLKLLIPLAALVMLTPLVSTSLRFKYLYLIVNILIVGLGAEAGLLSFFHRKPAAPAAASSLFVIPHKPAITAAVGKPVNDVEVKESATERSIFFIESGGEEEDDDQRLMMEVDDHELYNKSETFIGNFYKQLKMQREELSRE